MDVGTVLLDILVVLIAAKVAAEIAERVGFPAVVAEIFAGILIGPSVLALVGGDNETLRVLAEIGVILLLLQVGMEMNLTELGAVGRASISVAIIGVVVPMASGFGVAELFGYDVNTALFLGAALSATSVGITARVFSDLRALATVEARTVLGAAVADDVLGLVILTVVVRIVSEGSVSVVTVAGVIGLALLFLVGTVLVGSRAAPPLFQLLHRYSRSAGTVVALALAFTLAFAKLAEAAKLAPIVGAFVAGLSLSRSAVSERIARELTPVGHLFIPVFFLQIGIDARVEEFFHAKVLGVATVLLAVAVVGKLVAAVGASGAPGDKRLIGFGMIPRGEVGLIFATIGLRQGVLGKDLYAALLLVVLVTTMVTPPLLRWRLGQIRAGRAARTPLAVVRPEGGWLEMTGDAVDLVAEPPDDLGLAVGLEAARAVGVTRPGRRLLDWLGAMSDTPLRWDDAATAELFLLLREGNARTWRFLETTGLLERSLPELAEVVQRRRADPFVLDPTHVLRFSLVDRVRELGVIDARAAEELGRLEHPDWLLLGALVLDAAGEDASPVDVARRLVRRLDLGAAAEQEMALLIGDSSLLRAAASRVDGLDEESVLQLATHLDRPERARALYLLSLAIGELESWDRERLDELHRRVLAVLDQPELTGVEARTLVERRRAEAVRIVGEKTLAAERIAHAPRAFVLAQDAVDLARQAELIDTLPGRAEARVVVSPNGQGGWRVEVACRDRRGLLAHVAGVLAQSGLDVLDAVVATWGDGGAIDSFRVRRFFPPDGAPPEPAGLRAEIEASFEAPLASAPAPGASVIFDDDGSPWYTLCEVRSPDRRGLLRAITVGMAAAGANVHSARLRTVDATAVDRFELTDANGRKLDDPTKAAIRAAIAFGVVPRRRRLPRGRRRRDAAITRAGAAATGFRPGER